MFASRENNDRPQEAFWDLLFANRSGFDELINASGGIPRDFINRFESVAAAYEHSVEKKWTEHRIREVIIRHSIVRVADHVKKDAFLSCIFDKIGEVIKLNDNMVFLVPKIADRKLTSAVESLFASRLIHGLDLVIVPEQVRSKYDAYFLDYGTFLDLTHTKRKMAPKRESVSWPLPEPFSNEQLAKFVVNVQSCQVQNAPKT